MTREEMMRRLAREVAREVVRETCERLGVDTTHSEEIQKDLLYLRDLRKGSEETKRLLKRYFLTTFLTAIITLLVLGIKNWIKE